MGQEVRAASSMRSACPLLRLSNSITCSATLVIYVSLCVYRERESAHVQETEREKRERERERQRERARAPRPERAGERAGERESAGGRARRACALAREHGGGQEREKPHRLHQGQTTAPSPARILRQHYSSPRRGKDRTCIEKEIFLMRPHKGYSLKRTKSSSIYGLTPGLRRSFL